MTGPLLVLGLLQAVVLPDSARLQAVLDSTIPALMAEHGVPGAALVVVRGDTRMVLRGWGVASREANRPVDPERTVFRLASVAKLFVAAAALQQVEAGRLDLDADLRPLFPGVPIRGGGDAPVRLHDLLTHTAGFEERVVGMATARATGLRPLGDYLSARMPPRDVAPGARTSYSNHGYALAALAVERVTGTDFAAHAAHSLFAPLGMTRTSYRLPVGDSTGWAAGYRCSEGRCDPALPVHTHTYPAGLAYSTAADMGAFLMAMLGFPGPGGSRILDSTSLARMQAEQFTHDATLDGMGYGFWRHRWRTGELLLSHAGNVPGYVTLLQLAPERQLGFFLATNGSSAAFSRLASTALLGVLLPGEPAVVASEAVPGGDIGEFAGTYRLTRTARRSVETFPGLFLNPLTLTASGDTLVAHRSSGPVRFLRTGPLQFRSTDGLHRLAFRRNDQGAVALLMGGQPAFGGEFPAAYERLAWHDTPHFMNEYVSWLAMVPLLLLVVWGLAWGVGRIRRRLGRESVRRPVPGYAVALGILWAAGFVGFGFGFIARTNQLMAGPLAYGMTPALQVAAQVPWLLGIVAVLMLRASWAGWRERWRWGGLWCLSAMTVSAAAAMAFLVRWGYLPARW